jgi:hypothetical protein
MPTPKKLKKGSRPPVKDGADLARRLPMQVTAVHETPGPAGAGSACVITGIPNDIGDGTGAAMTAYGQAIIEAAEACRNVILTRAVWGEEHVFTLHLHIKAPDLPWFCSDSEGGYRVMAPTMEQAAQAFVDAGDYRLSRDEQGPDATTTWVSVRVAPCDDPDVEIDDEQVEEPSSDADWTTIKIAIDPHTPECADGTKAPGSDQQHNWQTPLALVGGNRSNPGVFSSGGGIRSKEVCVHCGCTKTTDTWAQDPEDGEQGLTAITFGSTDLQEIVDLLRVGNIEQVQMLDDYREADLARGEEGPTVTIAQDAHGWGWWANLDAPDGEVGEWFRSRTDALREAMRVLSAEWASPADDDREP